MTRSKSVDTFKMTVMPQMIKKMVNVLYAMLSLTIVGGTVISSAVSPFFPLPSAPKTQVFAPLPCPKSSSVEKERKEEKIRELIFSMTLREKLCQMFILYPQALGTNTVPAQNIDEEIKQGLKKTPVGGVIFAGDNLSTPLGTAAFIDDLQNESRIPLFVAVDEEGGKVARLANSGNFHVKKYSSMLDVGKSKRSGDAYNIGQTIGAYLSKYRFNLDFAPVADIFSNPSNTVIGNRSFGRDPKTVSAMALAVSQGLGSKGIISCFKHFPGHGDTAEDSHTGKVTVFKTWEELKEFELLPFIAAINSECDMIMVAHIDLPNVTNDGLPATLSKELLEGKLRTELGYTGVIITDGLEMKAIESHYTPAEYAVLAVKAGADILLLPSDFTAALDALEKAVEDGEISEERIEESLVRILSLKEKYMHIFSEPKN